MERSSGIFFAAYSRIRAALVPRAGGLRPKPSCEVAGAAFARRNLRANARRTLPDLPLDLVRMFRSGCGGGLRMRAAGHREQPGSAAGIDPPRRNRASVRGGKRQRSFGEGALGTRTSGAVGNHQAPRPAGVRTSVHGAEELSDAPVDL